MYCIVLYHITLHYIISYYIIYINMSFIKKNGHKNPNDSNYSRDEIELHQGISKRNTWWHSTPEQHTPQNIPIDCDGCSWSMHNATRYLYSYDDRENLELYNWNIYLKPSRKEKECHMIRHTVMATPTLGRTIYTNWVYGRAPDSNGLGVGVCAGAMRIINLACIMILPL